MKDEKSYELHAAWEEGHCIGRLIISHDRRGQMIAFEYEEDWLEKHPGFMLDPELFPFPGRQYAEAGLFGFLEDASPDRWGRELLKRKEQEMAEREGRSPRELDACDFLLGVEDDVRMGGIRIYDGNAYISHDKRRVPPLTSLRALEDCAHAFERAGAVLQNTDFLDLISIGSSLGGARPKMNVIDEAGEIWIAKFQSDRDREHTESWEYLTHELGEKCGLHMAEAKLEMIGNRSCYLTKRFDREQDARIHFASAMTMVGKRDGDDASFFDIAECISSLSCDARNDLQELWRRVTFSVLVNNTDCHLRNHGFLLTERGWRLAPAYDINPNFYTKDFALAIDERNRRPDLQAVIETAPYYEVACPREEIERMQEIIQVEYPFLAEKCRIPREEIVKIERIWQRWRI